MQRGSKYLSVSEAGVSDRETYDLSLGNCKMLLWGVLWQILSSGYGATDGLKQSPASYVVSWFSARQGVALWKIVLPA